MINTRAVKVAVLRPASLAVAPLMTHLPHRRPTPHSGKGVESYLVPVYLPVKRRKKKVRIIILHIA